MHIIKEAKHFIDMVASEPGGEKINECIQCGVCSGSCTTVEWWEYPPRKVIAMIRAGMKEAVLSSASAFNCVNCYMCTVRCPRNIQPSELMHAVMHIAEREGYRPKTDTKRLFRMLHRSVKRGRIWEFGTAAKFYLTTNIFLGIKVIPIALALVSRGLMPMLPPKSVKSDEMKIIFAKVKEMRVKGEY